MKEAAKIGGKGCSLLLPAHNEVDTIGNCCRVMKSNPDVAQIIVVANDCSDDTAKIATREGVLVVETQIKGKGHAIKIGLREVTQAITVVCDADLSNPSSLIVTRLIEPFQLDRIGLVKGGFDREDHPGPVTDILVKPVLKQSGHPASQISQPLSGMIAAKTDFLRSISFPDDFGVDLAILLSAYSSGWQVAEVELPRLVHRDRPWTHYKMMAEEVAKVMCFFDLIKQSQ